MIVMRWTCMLAAMVYSVQCKYTGIQNISLRGHGAYLRVLAILSAFSWSNTVSSRSITQRGGLLVANTAQAVQYVALVAGGFDTAKRAVCGSCRETCSTAGEKSICAKCERRKELRKKRDEELRKYEETWKAIYVKTISKGEDLEKKFESLKRMRNNWEGSKILWGSKLEEKYEILEGECEILKGKHEILVEKYKILVGKNGNSNSVKEMSQNVSNEEYKKELKKQWEDGLKSNGKSNVNNYRYKIISSSCSSSVRYLNQSEVDKMWDDMEKLVKKRCYSKHLKKYNEISNHISSQYANERESDYNVDSNKSLWNEPILSVMCKELDEDSWWEMRMCEDEMKEIGMNKLMKQTWDKKVERNDENLMRMCEKLYRMQSELREKYHKLGNECREQKEKHFCELEKKCKEIKRKYEEDLKVIRDVKGRDGGELTKKSDELKMECENETRKCEKEKEECENNFKRKLEFVERRHKEEDAKLKEEIVRDFLKKIRRTRDELKEEYEREVQKCKEGMEKCKREMEKCEREMEEMIRKRDKELEEEMEECWKGMEKCEIEKQRMLEDLKKEKEKIQRKYEQEGTSFFQALRDTFFN